VELILIVVLVAFVVAGAMWAIGTASRGTGTQGAAGRDADTPGATSAPDDVTDRSTRPPADPDRPIPGSRPARAEHPRSPASRPHT
jgi:hypothetical protein